MFSSNSKIQSVVSDFRLDYLMRYSLFVPRLFNLCLSQGFEPGNIMPSRAFCSDENQGFPIILIAKHFGAFPFNHGMVGGIVATDRHAPHAHHGKDLVIIQASHVGYDPEAREFGSYCRLQTTDKSTTTTCGKIGEVINWYQEEYRFAQNNIYIGRDNNVRTIAIDNQLMDERRTEGLFLDLDKLAVMENGRYQLQKTLSTSRVYTVSEELSKLIPDDEWPDGKRIKIGSHFGPDMFVYKRNIKNNIDGHAHLERNLIDAMPWIVTSPNPLLVAAQVNTQAEFDRTFRTIVKEQEYSKKKLLFISCLNIDISPQEDQKFPLTKCVPWAAYIQKENGSSITLEQCELVELLMQQSSENPHQIDLEAAIQQMIDAPEVKISLK